MIEKEKKAARDAEFKALQYQINPHFLFNAINTIVSYIRTSPDEGRRLLLKLGEVFRNSLNRNAEIVPVSEEIEHLESWLEIEKARFGDQLDIIFSIENRDVEILYLYCSLLLKMRLSMV